MSAQAAYHDDDATGEWRVAEPPARAGAWEAFAIFVLAIAGTGVPIVGWLVGMALVHLSDVWTPRDKTLAAAGPLCVVAVLVVVVAVAQRSGALAPFGLGPLPLLLLGGGAVAGWLGAAYLTVRAALAR